MYNFGVQNQNIMEQNLSITITKPCSEKFENFKKTKSGGFCSSCTKEVIDFRKMNDKELIRYFQNKTEQTCGYFNKSQLKTYEVSSKPERKTSFSLFKTIGFAFISMVSLQHVQAQNNEFAIEVVENAKQGKVVVSSKMDHKKELISGVITSESEPLPGVNIVLKGTGIGTTTNFDGQYEFPEKLKKGDVLVVSYLGFKTQEIKIKENQMVLNVEMPEDVSCVLIGEVDVNEVYTFKKNLWQKIKGIF